MRALFSMTVLLLALAPAGPANSASAQGCDAVAQSGCGPAEKCAPVADGADGGVCLPGGTVSLGGACATSPTDDSLDDCVAGTSCHDGVCAKNATRGTAEHRLPAASGHYVSPGFQNHSAPAGRAGVVVTANFDCSYAESPLFSVEYRFHFRP